MVASWGGTTPSDSEYRQLVGIAKRRRSRMALARGCIMWADAPRRWDTRRYSALTAVGDWLPEWASTLTGLPSVMTERTHSSVLWALYIEKTPPRLQPTRLTLRPVMWCR